MVVDGETSREDVSMLWPRDRDTLLALFRLDAICPKTVHMHDVIREIGINLEEALDRGPVLDAMHFLAGETVNYSMVGRLQFYDDYRERPLVQINRWQICLTTRGVAAVQAILEGD